MLYVLSDGSGFVKIGITNDIEKRIKARQVGNPRPISIIKIYEYDHKLFKGFKKNHEQYIENALHEYFSEYRVKVSSASEWFSEEAVKKLTDLNDQETVCFFQELIKDSNVLIRSKCESETIAGIIEERDRLKTECERLRVLCRTGGIKNE